MSKFLSKSLLALTRFFKYLCDKEKFVFDNDADGDVEERRVECAGTDGRQKLVRFWQTKVNKQSTQVNVSRCKSSCGSGHVTHLNKRVARASPRPVEKCCGTFEEGGSAFQ